MDSMMMSEKPSGGMMIPVDPKSSGATGSSTTHHYLNHITSESSTLDSASNNNMNGDNNNHTTINNNNNHNNHNSHQNTSPADAAEEDDDDTPEIDINITNVVSNFATRCHLNLRNIANNGANVIYKREQGMLNMKLRNPNATATIWSSGKITVTGSTSEDDAKKSARRVARILQKMGYKIRMTGFRIVNVLGIVNLPFGIKLTNFTQTYPKVCSYEPELHPGATYKWKEEKATYKIFQTGAITITAPNVAAIDSAVQHIYPLVFDFQKDKPNDPHLAHMRHLRDALNADGEDGEDTTGGSKNNKRKRNNKRKSRGQKGNQSKKKRRKGGDDSDEDDEPDSDDENWIVGDDEEDLDDGASVTSESEAESTSDDE